MLKVIICLLVMRGSIDYNAVNSEPACPLECVGATGGRGPKGDEGPKGLDGFRGAPGPIGPLGPRGYKGEIGDQGLPGLPGEQGSIGKPGPIGLPGQVGAKGEAGEIGPRGEKGEPWSPGKPSQFLRETLLSSSNTTEIKRLLTRLVIEGLVENAEALSELRSILDISDIVPVRTEEETTLKDRINNTFNVMGTFVDEYWYLIIVIGAFTGLCFQRKRRRSNKVGMNDSGKYEKAIELDDEHFHEQLNSISPLTEGGQ